MKILVIEDDPGVIDEIEDLLSEAEPAWKVEGMSFEDVKEKTVPYQTDAVILDIFSDISLSIAEGENVYDDLWEKYFRPIVIFSAGIEASNLKGIVHPFVRKIKKSPENYDSLLEALRDFYPLVQPIKNTKDYILTNLSIVVRDVAPHIFEEFEAGTGAERHEAVKRASRRRLAALMDESPNGDAKLVGWEQYIFPPINEDCLLGDVIIKSGGSNSEPSDFRIILSPSCDLVKRPKPKIKEILVAKCCSVADGLCKANKKNMRKNDKNKETIEGILRQGYINSVIPLPKLKGKIPNMFADMKDLELVPWENIIDKEESGSREEIGDKEKSQPKYYRVASVDSPFREMISQVYQLVSTRPGLPEREFESWVKELSEELWGKNEGD